MEINVDTVIMLNQDLYLNIDGWVYAHPNQKNDPEFLPKGRLQFNYIMWTEGPFNDVDPAYGFRMLDLPKDENYPEFSLEEIKRFLNDGTFELEE